MQVLPPDIGEYFSSFFITVVVAVFIFIVILQLKNVFFIIDNSYVRNSSLTGFLRGTLGFYPKVWLYIFHTS